MTTAGQSDGVLPGALALALALVACTPVDRGAVELSWRLRPEPGPRTVDPTNPFVNCASGEPGTGAVVQIRLDWSVGSASGSSAFPCNESTGITGFDLPPGTALLSIAPVCATCSAAAGTYVAPAPVEREVAAGEALLLGAVEILVEVSTCDKQPCICAACPTPSQLVSGSPRQP